MGIGKGWQALFASRGTATSATPMRMSLSAMAKLKRKKPLVAPTTAVKPRVRY